MNFLVRWIGRESYLCVYKRRKPKEVLMELLSTHSMENEKYKLIVPPSKIQKPIEDRATYREWSDKKIAHDEEANVQGFDTSQKGSFDHLNEQDNTSENPPLQNTDRPQTEGSGEDSTEPPSWVMNFIKSAKKMPPKPLYKNKKNKCPTEPKRCRDDVYSRWKFEAPKVILRPTASTSNVNFNTVNQRSVQPAWRDNVTPNNYDYSRYKYVAPKLTQPPVDSTSNVNFNRAGHGSVQPASNVTPNNYDHSKFNKYVAPEVTQHPVDFTSSVNFNTAKHGSVQPANNVTPNNYDHSRFNKYVVPKVTQPPVDSRSNVDFKRADQRPAQHVGRDNITPDNNSNETGGSTLSERLQKVLEGKNRSVECDSRSLENYQELPHTSKRPCDRGFDGGEPSWKIGKYTTHQYGAQQNMTERGEQSNNYFEGRNPTTGGAFGYNRGANERTSSCASSDTAKSFNLKTESTQRNSSLWDQGTKQQYDQRLGQSSGGNNGLSNLFDFNGPQDVTPQDFSSTPFPTPPKSRNRKPPWKKKKFKGHNFAKLEKYGKKGPH